MKGTGSAQRARHDRTNKQASKNTLFNKCLYKSRRKNIKTFLYFDKNIFLIGCVWWQPAATATNDDYDDGVDVLMSRLFVIVSALNRFLHRKQNKKENLTSHSTKLCLSFSSPSLCLSFPEKA